jgi:leucyl-tRNA synthetase
MRWSATGTRYWMPMDQYIGGIEHAILHLLYARFWTKVMRDLKLVDIGEPFTKLLTQGMVLNEAFVRHDDGKHYYWADDLNIVRDEHAHVVSATLKADGKPVQYEGWTTMSKSKNNGVDPQELIAKYGADTARLFVMFASPPEQTLEWNDAGVEGASRFLRRVWGFGAKNAEAMQPAAIDAARLDDAAKALRFEVHTVLQQISYDYERMQYNTVISGAMKLLNALEAYKGIAPGVGARRLRAAAARAVPGCPHIRWCCGTSSASTRRTATCSTRRGRRSTTALLRSEIELMLQVNGKLRGSIRVPADAGKHTIEHAALHSPEFIKFSEGKRAKKVIVVPGRLVNVVV